MYNIISYCLIILLINSINPYHAQENTQKNNSAHIEGLNALKLGKIDEAEKYFKISVEDYSYPPSYFELAKIYKDENTAESRAKARTYIQKAIWKDPENIEYRFLQADLMERFSRNLAKGVYEEILKIDPRCTNALFNLGRIKELEFYEYNKSVLKVDSDPSLSFDKFALEDFIKAEGYLTRTIQYDSSYINAYLHLSYLYEEIDEPAKAIPLLKKVTELEPANKEAYLYLGLLYYKTSDLDASYSSYQQALNLMNNNERDDFKYNSAELIVDKKLNDDFAELSLPDYKQSIDKFWNFSDPLYLTDYNERLLEHYSRVAYSNLRFSVPDMNVTGWDSDRGEILIRYGEPLNRIRYRPFISAGGRTALLLKTDLWIYRDKVFGFVDEYWNENFRFSTPRPGSRHHSQFAGDTDFFVGDLRRTDPEDYTPKYEGIPFSVPFNIIQFKNLDNNVSNTTDLYLNYALDSYNVKNTGVKYPLSHKYGLYFINSELEQKYQKINSVKDINPKRYLKLALQNEFMINTITMNTSPDSGELAFEIIMKEDNGVSSNHFVYEIREFKKEELDISDIILASSLNENPNEFAVLTRGNYNILPNPLQTFTNSTDIFIYYEVYNLDLDKNNTSDFTQMISIQKVDEETEIDNAINSVLSIFGLGNEDDIITLKTNYQSFEKDVPVYLQLDMNKYQKGDYIITITIEDNLNGSIISTNTVLKWR